MAGMYPPLAKSDYLGDKDKVIEIVIKGRSDDMIVNGKQYHNTMPPQNLSDEEIAAVLTYVYTMGNSSSAVTQAEVKAVRERIK